MLTTTPRPATRGHRVRRRITAVLPRAASLVTALGVLAASTVGATSIAEVGPDWMQLTDGAFLVLVLATYGVVRFGRDAATDIAAAIDPDTSDGDDAHQAAGMLQQLTSDLANGADVDAVHTAIHDSRVLVAMGDALATLAAASDDENKTQQASAERAAADHVYRAARELCDQRI